MLLIFLIAVCTVLSAMLLHYLITTAPTTNRAGKVSADATKWDNAFWNHQEFPFHCVSCRCSAEHCKAADPLKKCYFLVKGAPELPVPECTAIPCQCRYVHYEDRRHEECDRREIFGIQNELYRYTQDQERRKVLGRRMEDWAVA